MSFLKLSVFTRKYLTFPIDRIITKPRKFTGPDIELPTNTVIHYLPEITGIRGINNMYPLLMSGIKPIYSWHHLHRLALVGSTQNVNFNVAGELQQYFKSHLAIKKINNLDRSLSGNPAPIVIDYSLLPMLYKTSRSPLSVYHEWFNTRATMWDMVNVIGERRTQFIRYQLPEVLPTKAELTHQLLDFTVSGLLPFHSTEALDILELWRIINPEAETPVSKLSEEAAGNTFLVFSESGVIIIILLKDLLDWAEEDSVEAAFGLYKFLDNLISLRSSIALSGEELAEGRESLASDDNTIAKMIQEQHANGKLSAGEVKGLLKLSTKYKTIKDPLGSGLTLDQMGIDNEETLILNKSVKNDSIAIHDKSHLNSKLKVMDLQYDNEMLHRDIISSILMLHPAGVIVKDIKVKNKHTAVSKTNTYSVSLQPIVGEATTIQFTIPVINPDGTFKTGNVLYRLDKQKGELPIIKDKPNSVALTSYYGKLFIGRNESAMSNYSRWILKGILECASGDSPSIKKVIYGTNNLSTYVLPRSYTAIAETVDNFSTEDLTFYFNYSKIGEKLNNEDIKLITEAGLTPIGYDNKAKKPLGMSTEDIVYAVIGKEEFIQLGTVSEIIKPGIGNGPIEYTECSIFNRRIALGVMISYIYGLDNMLNKLNIKFDKVASNIKPASNAGTIILSFKDVSYVITINRKNESLLVGGLFALRKELANYKSTDLLKPNAYLSILSKNNISSYHLREIKQLWDMFIEPITLGLLKSVNGPTTFLDLLLAANDLLINDYVPVVHSTRIKGYERVCGMMYSQLVQAVRAHRSAGPMSNVGVTIKPNAVFLDIISDQSVALVEQLNPIHNLKEHAAITHVGAGGRSAVTMVKHTRKFKDSDMGVISEASPDSGKVGIRAFLTADPNFDSVRGTSRLYDEKTDGAANILSVTALLAPGADHDDSKRVNFINVQHSHGVSAVGYQPLAYRTGYEEVVGSLVDDIFAVVADEDGIVLQVTKNIITVKYASGKIKSYELGIRHGLASGKYIPHTLVTDLDKGSKFKTGENLLWNDWFFTRSEFDPTNVVYKAGVIARIAFLENADTIEDSCVLGSKLAEKLARPISTVHTVIGEFNTLIHNLIIIGTECEPETPLCTVEDNVSSLITDEKDIEAIQALQALKANTPTAKVYGIVTEIEVLYYGNKEDMHPALKLVLEQYDKRREKKTKLLDPNGPLTGQIDEPIRVNGKKLIKNQFAITIYIDSMLPMGAGDKVVFGNALKSTCARVETNTILSEDGEEIDGMSGYQSIADRIVGSPEKAGIGGTVMMALSKKMGELYTG